MHRILIADDSVDICEALSVSLAKKGFVVETAPDGGVALELINKQAFDVVLTDLRMPVLDGMELLKKIVEISPQTLVIMITAFGTVEDAVEAMRYGAFDYVLKPFSSQEIEVKIRKALEHRRLEHEKRLLKEENDERRGGLVANSLRMQEVAELIDSYSKSTVPVLICGKGGTGKELAAREIHNRGERAERPFAMINCVAIDPVIQELELFGCEKGVRDDVPDGRKGKVETAEGGTIFVDEIGELGGRAQEKLLSLITRGDFRRVGGSDDIAADVRIIASTSEPLDSPKQQAKFSRSLFDKFSACSVKLPELKERADDIADLAEHFVDKYAAEFHKHVKLSPEAIGVLKNHNWPGNVHELENVLARAVILCKEKLILPSHLPIGVAGSVGGLGKDVFRKQGVAKELDAIESAVIRDALEKEGWNQSHAARRLGMKRTTLQYKLKKYGIKKA